MTTVRLSREPAHSIDADALVIGVHSGSDGPVPALGAEAIDAALDGNLSATLTALGATGKAGEITKIPSLGAAPAEVIVAAGLGDATAEPYDAEILRRAAGAAVRALAGRKSVVLALPAESTEQAEAVTLGGLLGAYAFLRYRTNGDQKPPVESLTVATQADVGSVDGMIAVSESVNLVRDLVNTPPSDLRPTTFADLAEERAKAVGIEVEVLDDKALREAGYGGIVGVGQGSTNPPRLVRLSYSHPAAVKKLAFVGKGVTFDSGGLNLKPSAGMDWMKSDMGGAAAVLGALLAIARLKPAVNVIGYLPLVENMPSGTAQRPSDVLTTFSGKTVEVLDTDAEGRLILVDGIARAGQDAPDLIVDVATLTGAQLVALGARTAGVMANDDDVREQVLAAAAATGEPMWGMPLPEELRKSLDSTVADIANVHPDRWGGMLTAGVFLKEFVPDGIHWAHLDIAGPAFNKGEPYGYTPKGGTGAATRTLIRLAEEYSSTDNK